MIGPWKSRLFWALWNDIIFLWTNYIMRRRSSDSSAPRWLASCKASPSSNLGTPKGGPLPSGRLEDNKRYIRRVEYINIVLCSINVKKRVAIMPPKPGQIRGQKVNTLSEYPLKCPTTYVVCPQKKNNILHFQHQRYIKGAQA